MSLHPAGREGILQRGNGDIMNRLACHAADTGGSHAWQAFFAVNCFVYQDGQLQIMWMDYYYIFGYWFPFRFNN